MCNDDAKGNFLICFINRILFQLKFIFQKKKTTLIFARFSRNFNPWEWLDSKSDQLYLSHNVICLQKGGPFYIFWLNFNLYRKSNQASHPKWDRSHYFSWKLLTLVKSHSWNRIICTKIESQNYKTYLFYLNINCSSKFTIAV